MENTIRQAAENLVETIRGSEVYRHYMESAGKLKEMPEIFDQVMDLRLQTIDVYYGEDSDERLENSERLAARRDELQKHPEVDAFLEAEEELVRTLQEAGEMLSGAVDLYLPDTSDL